MKNMNKEKIVIIDGNSLINRAFYAIQRPMMTKDGIYTQGVYGFLSMLNRIMSDYEPSHMLVAFDRKTPTFRHIEYEEYKAGRKKMPMELAMQLPILKDILKAMGITIYEMDGFEADDIIGTTAVMAEKADIPAYVITGDKDALQLANDKTSVIITKKGISQFQLYDDVAMMEEYGFDHNQYIDYKALRGDASDNIPGIDGVGEKTAIKLIQQYGSVEEVIRHAEELKGTLRQRVEDGAMQAMVSKKLVTIATNVPVDYTMEDLKIGAQNTNELIDIYTRLEFKTHLNNILKNRDRMVLKEENQAEVFEYPKVVLIGNDELSELLEGELVIDIDSDDSHTAVPETFSIQILKNGKVYVWEKPELQAFNGKQLSLTGFNLGRLYYALFCAGVDCSSIETAFDCALAKYVLSPSVRAQSLAAVLLESFHVSIEQEAEQISLFDDTVSDYSMTSKKLVLLDALKKRLQKEIEAEDLQTVLYEIELPLCKVLASMEAEGIKVDSKELYEFGKKLKHMVSSLEYEIHDMTGENFNLNSPQQLGIVLFEKLGLPSGKKTSRGYSTSADILEKLAPEYPVVAKVLEYRSYAKLNSTYVEGLLPLIAADGKIRAHFQQTVTATGRISCTEPNLQNIPIRQELGRKLRKVFTAESSDYILIGADYSQIELRVMAHMSQDKGLIEAFEGGHDIHKETASKIFRVPLDKVTPQMRSNAKAVNFGVIYGMSSFGLAGELTISRKQAEKYIRDYFERFPQVKDFLDKQVSDCKKNGSVRTLFGRKRAIPEINASNFVTRQLGERLAMNTPIQGTAADIIKIAMNKIHDRLEKECPGSSLILQIHDELIIQAKKSEADKAAQILKECMEGAAELSVKLSVDTKSASNWYDLG